MKKTIIFTILGAISLITLIQSGVLESLAMFLMVGLVPGTTYTVAPSTMFLIMCAAIWLVIFRYTAIEMFVYRSQVKRTKKQQAQRSAHLPRRRFKQV